MQVPRVLKQISAILDFKILYSFFWVIPRASEFYAQAFRNSLFDLHRWCKLTPPMKMEQGFPKIRHVKFRCPGNHLKNE